jgi:hypothetical protein
MGNFTRKHRWEVFMAFVLIVLSQWAHAQSGSFGSTFAHTTAEMAIYGQHDFVTGSGTINAGIIGSERQPTIGMYSFVNPAGSWINASNTAFVDGYVRTYHTGPFTFPIGDNNKYRPAAVSASSAAAPTTAAYYGVDPGTATTSDLKGGTYGILPGGGPAFPTTAKDVGVGTVDNVEYWDIDGTTPARITLTWDAATPINAMVGTDLSKLTIVGWDGSQWVVIPSTVDAGSLVLNTSASAFTDPAGTVSAGSITTNATVVPGSHIVYTLAGLCSLTLTSSGNLTICSGQPASLTVGGDNGAAVTWTNNLGQSGSGTSINFPGLITGGELPQLITYTILAQAGSCKDEEVVTITVNPAPSLVVTPSQVVACAPATINLRATASPSTAVIDWSRDVAIPTPASGSNPGTVLVTDVLPAGTYNYTFKATGTNGCSSPDKVVQVIVNN